MLKASCFGKICVLVWWKAGDSCFVAVSQSPDVCLAYIQCTTDVCLAYIQCTTSYCSGQTFLAPISALNVPCLWYSLYSRHQLFLRSTASSANPEAPFSFPAACLTASWRGPQVHPGNLLVSSEGPADMALPALNCPLVHLLLLHVPLSHLRRCGCMLLHCRAFQCAWYKCYSHTKSCGLLSCNAVASRVSHAAMSLLGELPSKGRL